MKSSTIRRSTLSRETMEVIENLAKDQEQDGGLGEYVRPDEVKHDTQDSQNSKTQEIDLLWQNFKATQFNTNSPTAYVLIGFVSGLVVSLIMTLGTGYYLTKSGKLSFHSVSVPVHKSATLEQQAESAQDIVEAKVSVPTEDETTSVSATVQVNTPADNEVSLSSGGENTSEIENYDKSKMKKYIVKNGDTAESIIKNYYGSYSPEKAELIKKVNKLESLDRINIDQEIWLPVK